MKNASVNVVSLFIKSRFDLKWKETGSIESIVIQTFLLELCSLSSSYFAYCKSSLNRFSLFLFSLPNSLFNSDVGFENELFSILFFFSWWVKHFNVISQVFLLLYFFLFLLLFLCSKRHQILNLYFCSCSYCCYSCLLHQVLKMDLFGFFIVFTWV